VDSHDTVIEVECRNCHAPMLVVEGSAPDRERLCNSCVYAIVRVTG
jgi:hypothetical protein